MTDETIATGYLRLVPSVDGIQGAIGSQFTGAGQQAARGFSAGFLPAMAGLLAIAGGALLAREVKQFVGEGISALSRIETIQAQTQSVITSTGNAANVSADQVSALADALERTTATEAETIQEGANLLLTFKNIRNEAGAGNNIFDQTVARMVDVGRAMGTDASGAAIQLGKALNDPIAGIAALTRVGITFTDEQKELIKSLVEQGDLLSAQKIILGELESQFGGSGASYAATFAGKLDLVRNSAGNLQERLVAGLMPSFEGFLDLAQTVLTKIDESPAFQSVIDRINALGTVGAEKLGRVVDLIERLSSAGTLDRDSIFAGLAEIFPQLEPVLQLIEELSPAFPIIRDGLLEVGSALSQEGVGDSLVELVSEVLPSLAESLAMIAPLIPPIADLLGVVLPPAIDQLTQNSITPLLTALELLDIWLNGGSITDWASEMFLAGDGLTHFAFGIGNFVLGLVNPIIDALNGIGDAVENFVNSISAIFGGPQIALPELQRLLTVGLSGAENAPGGRVGGKPSLTGTVARAPWSAGDQADSDLLAYNVASQVSASFEESGGGRARVEMHVHPTPGMSEETIARVAVDEINYELR